MSARADITDITLASGAMLRVLPWREPEQVFAPLASQPFALWFDSCDTAHPLSRISYICAAPIDILTMKAGGAFAALANFLPLAPIWDGLEAACMARGLPTPPPFRGGVAGMLAYDLGRDVEELPPHTPPYAIDDMQLPDLAVGLYADCLAFDAARQHCFIFASNLSASAPPARRLDIWQERLARAAPLAAPAAATPQTPHANFTRRAYEAQVDSIIAHIRAGDIFQANIAQRFTARLGAGDSAFDFYRRLRHINPAPFACFAQFDDFALASASPERFLHIADGQIETRPIKGTQARRATPAADRAAAAALAASDKDRAENVMIVDLMRNDLARICRDHSVKVTQLCAPESFADVHHLVSVVRGELRAGSSAVDALKACFPGGSISGAPKIRAQELIAAHEPHCRGAYCGALAMLGFDGYLDSSIAIRTALICGRDVHFHGGGGITANSDAASEYDETLAKLHSFMRAAGADVAQIATAE